MCIAMRNKIIFDQQLTSLADSSKSWPMTSSMFESCVETSGRFVKLACVSKPSVFIWSQKFRFKLLQLSRMFVMLSFASFSPLWRSADKVVRLWLLTEITVSWSLMVWVSKKMNEIKQNKDFSQLITFILKHTLLQMCMIMTHSKTQ